ncbi:MAG: PaaI family thioesterase [Sterolibacterium sp.]|nr:PaaI family thioesterase [Sterolibacterium sp.]
MNTPQPPDSSSSRPATAQVSFPEPVEDSDILREKRRAGNALRRIIDGIIMKHPAVETMAALADQLEHFAEGFNDMPDKAVRTSFGHRISAEDVRDFIEFSPLTGTANPVAAPLKLWTENGRAVGSINFGRSFEGAPGVAHGGFVAAIFDEVLGFAQGFSGRPGMTGTLTITYRAPTPLFTDLRIEGSFDGVEGRKIHTRGKLYNGETLLAEAHGLFISLTDEQYASVAAMQDSGAAE